MNNNEWAAEFLGLKLKHRKATTYPDLECPAHSCYEGDDRSCYGLWQPDTDLNQFKLVLDRYSHWSGQKARRSELPRPELLQQTGWNNTANTLKAIREAYEKEEA